MDVVLIGKGPGKEFAPLIGKGKTIWGVNDTVGERQCDACFFMDRQFLRDTQLDETITKSVNTTGTLLYSTQKWDDIKNSEPYPLEEVKKCFGIDYFADSCCYMIALAIYQGFQHIILYGFTYGWGSTYVDEKPGVTFWLGVALGRGLKISVHGEHTALLKNEDGTLYGYKTEQNPSLENIKSTDFVIPVEAVRFGISDRVQLIGFLPATGDYKTVKFSKYMRENLLFNVEESKQLNFRHIADKAGDDKPFLVWDKNEIPDKFIELTQAEKSMIASWLFEANNRGEINYHTMGLYEKFCLGDST
jgi:hypothetical protein